MWRAIKVLGAVFIFIFAYDTVTLILQNWDQFQSDSVYIVVKIVNVLYALSSDSSVELAPEVVVTEVIPFEDNEEMDEDTTPGVIVFFWMMVIVTYLLSRLGKIKLYKIVQSVAEICQSCVYRYEQSLPPEKDDRKAQLKAHPSVESQRSQDVSELFRLDPFKSRSLSYSKFDLLDYSGHFKEKEKLPLSDDVKQNIVIIDQLKNELADVVEIGPHPSYASTNFGILNTSKETLTSCHCDQFGERLEAVETSLKSTEMVTKEWGKRIEQAEQELISLHQQMYAALSQSQLSPIGEANSQANKTISFQQFTQSIKDSSQFPHVEQAKLKGSLFKSCYSGGDSEDQVKLGSESVRNFNNLKQDDSRMEVKKILDDQMSPCVRKNILKSKKSIKLVESWSEKMQTSCVESKRDLLIKQEKLRERTNSIVEELEAAIKRRPKYEKTTQRPQHQAGKNRSKVSSGPKKTMYTECSRTRISKPEPYMNKCKLR